MNTSLPITFDDIAAAHQRLRGVVHRTPVLRSRTLDEAAGARIVFKPENLQRAGAFKLRGAYNAIAQFSPEQRRRGVVTFSSGNHAQAVALAARLLGVKATILMPQDAPQAKLDATRGYGAEVLRFDRYAEDPQARVATLVADHGMTLVPPFDHPHVMAGQGTLAKELFEDAGPQDVLITPVGGGGLLSGCAVAAQRWSPGCRMFGVEPEAGNDAQQSLAAGRIVRIDTPRTIADAAQSRSVGQYTFPVLQRHVEAVLTVSDDELVQAMAWLAQRMKLVAEPTGCLALAAVLARKLDLRGLNVGVVLSGGNVDIARFAQWLGGTAGPSGAG
jgi:threonine dehydratase